MNPWRHRTLHLTGLLLALLALGGLVLTQPARVSAQGGGNIRVLSTLVESQFPKGVLFKVQVEASQPLRSITLRFRVGGQRFQRYANLDFQPARSVSGELLVRTDTADRYVPPGAEILHFFEIEDAGGGRLETEAKSFVLLDPRFQWQQVEQGQLSVLYYGPLKSRAERALQATAETIERMGGLLGVKADRPLRVVMYNNYRDMLGALPPESVAIRRELITEGQAYSDEGVVLTLASGGLGVASHEVTHFLVYLVAGGSTAQVPSWLNEGLAEYGNIDSGLSYDAALAQAIRQDKLLPITSLTTYPGTSEQTILLYGQGKSIVKFMVDTYGAEKLQALFQAIRARKGIDAALQEAYGVDRIGLETQWRKAIGAPPLKPEEVVREAKPEDLPTPTPVPTLVPFGIPTPLATTIPAPQAAPTPASSTGGCGRAAFGSRVGLDWLFLIGLATLGAMRSLSRK